MPPPASASGQRRAAARGNAPEARSNSAMGIWLQLAFLTAMLSRCATTSSTCITSTYL
jgi:hypothetical protein